MSAVIFNNPVVDPKLVQDHKRERDHKHKWARGQAIITPGNSNKRPAKSQYSLTLGHNNSRRAATGLKPALEFQADPHAVVATIARKHNHRFDRNASTPNSSAEEDIIESSAAPEPDAGISYSFDAPTGPTEGGQILSMALTKAVEKFEIKATEKLIREEYEVVGKEKDDSDDGFTADVDDFELV